MERSYRELRAPLVTGQVAFLFDAHVCKIVFGADWTRGAFATADEVRYAIEEGSAEGDAILSDDQVAAFRRATAGMSPARWRAYRAAKSGRVAQAHSGASPAELVAAVEEVYSGQERLCLLAIIQAYLS